MRKPKKKLRGNRHKRKPGTSIGTIRTPEMREKILNVLRETGGSLSCAAITCGIGVRTAYDWQADDDDFRLEILEASNGPGADKLEDVAMNHAVNGVPEPVIFQGQQQYVMKLVEKTRTSKKTGIKTKYWKQEPVFDEKGQPIPLVVMKFDHGLLTRMLDRRRPVASLNKIDIGPGLEQLLTEMNKGEKGGKK